MRNARGEDRPTDGTSITTKKDGEKKYNRVSIHQVFHAEGLLYLDLEIRSENIPLETLTTL